VRVLVVTRAQSSRAVTTSRRGQRGNSRGRSDSGAAHSRGLNNSGAR
jgi:hypothetical protein